MAPDQGVDRQDDSDTASGPEPAPTPPEAQPGPATPAAARSAPVPAHDPAAIDDPLLNSLTTLIELVHQPVSVNALVAGLPYDGTGFTPELCLRAADQVGVSARVLRRREITDIDALTLPCILLLKNGRSCVLVRFAGTASAEVIFPESGNGTRTVSLKELQADYLGNAVFARPRFKFDNRAPEIKIVNIRNWFWGTLGKFWRVYSHVFLASILINTFALASPIFIMMTYDRVVPNAAYETLWALALGVALVFAFEFIMRTARGYFVDVAGKNADVILESHLLRHVMGMRLDKKPDSTGGLANNLRELESLREFFTSGTLVAFVDLPFIFLFIAMIWFIGGPLALIPLFIVPLVLLVGFLLQIPLRSVLEQSFRESIQKHALLVESISGLETIKSLAAEGPVQRRWERFVGQASESSRKSRFLSILAINSAQIGAQMSTVGIVVYGVYLINAEELSMGAMIACVILSGRALTPLGTVAGMLVRLQQTKIALRSLDVIMKTPVERPAEKTFQPITRLSGRIDFRNVNFSYPSQDGLALENVSLRIAPGERVGIIGRVGSGKSTMARLVLGLYEPSEGMVMVDGHDIRQIDPSDVRRNIGYVSQESSLFYGSVRENIAFGAPFVSDEHILRAADAAGVSDFTRSHPQGLDLKVGERGAALSGGQRQAIAVARALVLNPPVLLLDEPTSNMDTGSERQLVRRLSENIEGKTVIIITHRSSLLSLVNRLVIVDGGKIVADGPRDTVLKALQEGKIAAAAAAQ